MTVKGPRVRDYTARSTELDVVVAAAESFEVLVALYVYGEDRSKGMDYDDPGFFERVDARISEQLRLEISELGSCWSVWLSLLGTAWEQELHTVSDLLRYLRSTEPGDFRRHLLTMSGVTTARGHSPETIELAIAGDPKTLDELLDTHFSGLRRLLESKQPESRDRVATVIERFAAEAMTEELARSLPALRRDAADKRALATTVAPEQLVEVATKGITFEPEATIEGIVLIPSVVLAPWAVVTARGPMRIFCYSIDVDQFAVDPAAPPVHLVDLYKALGDERRLRLLAALAGGDYDLRTLSETVDLAKSTTHHHLRVLRGAGLVRVVISDKDRRYALRKEGISEAGPMLDGFLASVRAVGQDTDVGKE